MVYSTAFVLHKSSNGGLRASTTTVKSDSSGEIILDNSAAGQTWEKEIPNMSKSTTVQLSDDDLKKAFQNLIKTVVEVIRLHKKDVKDFPLPLIIGLEKSVINRNQLKDQLIRIFKASLDQLGIDTEDAKQMTFDKFIKLFIQKTLEKNNLESKDIFIQVRDYLSTEEVANLGIETNQGAQLSSDILEYESKLQKWVEQAKSGLEALKKLRQHAITLGQGYASMMYPNHVGTRFLQIGGRKDPARKNLLSNNVLREFDLREVAQNAYRQFLNIKHHIFMKVPQDPNKRPFQDVAATYIRDIIAKIPINAW
jgi:hypothetical protein